MPARIDAGGFDRHTFLCGQSGSGKSYSLGVVLEQLLLETDLRIVVLDPNSDCARLPEVRAGADPAVAARWRGARPRIVVRSAAEGAGLRLRFFDLERGSRRPWPASTRSATARSTARCSTWSRRGRAAGLQEIARRRGRRDARALNGRVRNLGLLAWPSGRGAGRAVLEDLDGGDWRCLVVDLGTLGTPRERRSSRRPS